MRLAGRQWLILHMIFRYSLCWISHRIGVTFYLEMESSLEDQTICWLVIENRILTWDNYVKRGGIGLGFCLLSLKIWKEIKLWFGIAQNQNQNYSTVESCFKNWKMFANIYKGLSFGNMEAQELWHF